MSRSSLAVKSLALGLLVIGSIACGDKPPPKAPDTSPSTSTDADGGTTTAGGETHDADGGTTTAGGDTKPPAAPAALALPSAAAKLKFKTTKPFDLELKSDGSVSSGGKPAAKISGMELQDPGGKGQLKVDGDGTVTTADGAAYAKFDGDDLTTLINTKYGIGDDGALQMTNEKGAKSSLGKTEGVGSAKRAALLSVAFVMWGTKAPAPPAAKGDGKKPAGDGKKPAGDGKKPAAGKK